MSDDYLRPNPGRASRMAGSETGGGGFWILVAGIAVVLLFAAIFISGSTGLDPAGPEIAPAGIGDPADVAPQSGTPPAAPVEDIQ
ncbi:MAG: hypothetical protein QNJ44_13195 [Rhodobacter sp.]|nr:hypothetical protein [Rhodobacter sp.]